MNNKGLTLTELLAIIVILGILFIIITPRIQEVLRTQRFNTFKSSTAGIIESVSRDLSINADRRNLEFMEGLLIYEYRNGRLVLNDNQIETTGHIRGGEGRIYVNRELQFRYVITDGRHCIIKECFTINEEECPPKEDSRCNPLNFAINSNCANHSITHKCN